MLKNKVVVVTGGAGLPRARICKSKFWIIREFQLLQILIQNVILQVAKTLQEQYPDGLVEFQPLNINDAKVSILELINILYKYGRIDALVNNAYPRNKNYGRKFEDVTYDDFCENFNINLGGYFLTSQQFLKYFEQQGYGSIVNISSIWGNISKI